MRQFLLDREGVASVPEGFVEVATEVEFLRAATEDKSLLVRGERLCTWAEVFCRARQIACREETSVRRQMQELCPELSDNQALELAHVLGGRFSVIESPLSVWKILQVLHPTPLWHQAPSVRHMAEWLKWLYEVEPADYVQPLLARAAQGWRENVHTIQEATVYQAYTATAAQQLLEAWLGIQDRSAFPLEAVYPVEVGIPGQLLEMADLAWRKRIAESHGRYFDDLVRQKLPFGFKQRAAQELCLYYAGQPQELTLERIEQLASYVERTEIDRLRKHLPPALPSELPAEVDAVLNWFRREYLPFREWQSLHAPEQAGAAVLRMGRDFGLWYLEHYPSALNGAPLQKHLSFQKALAVGQLGGLTLLVVLDGLHVPDARTLLQILQSKVSRLHLASDALAFAPLPTITEFAKEALFHGVPPSKVSSVEPIGDILPESVSPAARLRNAPDGQLYVWRVLEPDSTYHKKNRSANLMSDIRGRLEAEALKIKEIVEAVPATRTLQIIITSDHGRLLGKTVRSRPVPPGMESHGRAAWGVFEADYPTAGYLVQEDVAFLMGERFGLETNVAIPLDESGFMGNEGRGGEEFYPHGGLFPEEVIVPWIELVRDVSKPKIEVEISGKGRARRNGVLGVRILNLGDVDVFADRVILRGRDGRERQVALQSPSIKPRTDTTVNVGLDNWPSPNETPHIQAVATIRQPNQLQFDYEAVVNLVSEDIYVAHDNILEDLE